MGFFWRVRVFGILALGVAAGFFFRFSFGARRDFLPVLDLAKEVAIQHQVIEDRVSSLAAKAGQLKVKFSLLPKDFVEREVSAIIQAGGTVLESLDLLNSQMSQLRDMMHERELTTFDVKFTVWGTRFDAAFSEAERFEEITDELRQSEYGKQLPRTLGEASESLKDLTADLKDLHVRFQVIGNILQVFRHSGFKILPPDDRVIGESFDVHIKRTGHTGMADPNQPQRIFASHSKYAIEDKNPRHDIWACEATLIDFLKGRVRGTDFAYANSTKTPFCERCHEPRKGQHNMRWCIREHQNELIRACNIIEKTKR